MDVTSILNAMVHLGAVVKNTNDDMLSVKCNTVDSLNDCVGYLDNCDFVDGYNVIAYYNNSDGIQIEDNSIDVDMLSTINNAYFFINIFVKIELVSYDMYHDIDTDDELHERYGNTNNKKPLWMALNGLDTKVKGGKFIVEPHPKKRDCVWVYIEYKFNKNITHDVFFNDNIKDIKKDIESVNSGFIFNKFKDKQFTVNRKVKLDSSDVDFIKTYQKDGRLQTKHVEFKHANSKVNVRLLLEMFNKNDDVVVFGDIKTLNEIERKLKVNSTGKKRIKLTCRQGFRYDNNRNACVKINGAELSTMRKAKIKMVRTKKAKGVGYKKLTVRRTNKAMRFRKLMNI